MNSFLRGYAVFHVLFLSCAQAQTPSPTSALLVDPSFQVGVCSAYEGVSNTAAIGTPVFNGTYEDCCDKCVEQSSIGGCDFMLYYEETASFQAFVDGGEPFEEPGVTMFTAQIDVKDCVFCAWQPTNDCFLEHVQLQRCLEGKGCTGTRIECIDYLEPCCEEFDLWNWPAPTEVPSPAPTLAPTPFPTPQPAVGDCLFSAAGTSVSVEFTVDTNGVSAFPLASQANCQTLFDDASYELLGGAGTTCHFASPTELLAQLNVATATIEPEDTLTLAASSGLTRTDADASAGTTITTDVGASVFLVQAPTDVADGALAAPVIVAPVRVGDCSSSVVDISAFYGGLGGRDGTWAWTMSGDGCPSMATMSSDTATISMASVAVFDSCDIELSVTSFLGLPSPTAQASVLRTLLDEPTLALIPDEASPWTRDEGHVIAAEIDFPSCVDSTASALDLSAVEFSWALTEVDTSTQITLDSPSSPAISIASFVLEVGRTYRFACTLRDTTAPASFDPFTQTFDVLMEHGELTAAIAGDADLIEHPIARELVLDASASTDADVRTAPDGHFVYDWVCSRLAVTAAAAIGVDEFSPSAFSETDWADCNSLLDARDEEQLTVAADALAADSVYRLTLNLATSDGRTSADQVYAFTTALAIPVVSISVQGSQSVLATDTLRLEGSVESTSADIASYQWSETAVGVLSSAEDAADYLLTSLDGLNLALAPGLLTEVGQEYAFRLTVTDVDGRVGSSSVLIRVVVGPTITEFAVLPLDADTGEPKSDATDAVETDLFQLTVAAVDSISSSSSDLSYRFSYSLTEVAEETILTSDLALPTATVHLPAGDLLLYVRVTSESGLSSVASHAITVAEVTDSCAAAATTLANLEASLDSRSADSSFQSAHILALRYLDEAFVEECDVDVDAARDYLFATLPEIWSFQPVHSISQSAQLAHVVKVLSDDTAHFTLEQVSSALFWVDTVYTALDSALEQNLQSEGVEVGAAIANTLSNCLLADGVEESPTEETTELYCTVVTGIRQQLQRLLLSEVAELLVGEVGVEIAQETIVAQAIQAAVGEGADIDVDGAGLRIYIDNSDDDGDSDSSSASVSLSAYDTTVNTCFNPTDGLTIVSPVIDIDILECDDADPCVYSVGNVTFRLAYATVVNNECSAVAEERVVEALQCSFWDEDLLLWSTDGCSIAVIDHEQAECECNHLTTFTVLKSYTTERDVQGCAVRLADESAIPLFLCYVILFLFCITQMAKLTLFSRSGVRVTRAYFTFSCILVSVLAKGLFVVAISWWRDIYFLHVTVGFGLVLQFGVFAFVVQQWASVYHSVFQVAHKQRVLRIVKVVFVSASVLIALALLSLLIGFATLSDVNSDAFANLALAGQATISGVSFLSAAVFGFYGTRLIGVVMKSYRNVKTSSTGSKSTKRSAQRIKLYMSIFVCSFLVESGVGIISILVENKFTEDFTAFQSFAIAANVASLGAVMVLSATLVETARQTYNSKQQASATGTKTGRNHSGGLHPGGGSRSGSVPNVQLQRVRSTSLSHTLTNAPHSPSSPRRLKTARTGRLNLQRAHTESRSQAHSMYDQSHVHRFEHELSMSNSAYQFNGAHMPSNSVELVDSQYPPQEAPPAVPGSQPATFGGGMGPQRSSPLNGGMSPQLTSFGGGMASHHSPMLSSMPAQPATIGGAMGSHPSSPRSGGMGSQPSTPRSGGMGLQRPATMGSPKGQHYRLYSSPPGTPSGPSSMHRTRAQQKYGSQQQQPATMGAYGNRQPHVRDPTAYSSIGNTQTLALSRQAAPMDPAAYAASSRPATMDRNATRGGMRQRATSEGANYSPPAPMSPMSAVSQPSYMPAMNLSNPASASPSGTTTPQRNLLPEAYPDSYSGCGSYDARTVVEQLVPGPTFSSCASSEAGSDEGREFSSNQAHYV